MFAAIISFFLIVLFVIMAWTNVFEVFQLKTADLLYGSNLVPSEDIVIVGINDLTLDPLNGLGPVSQWSRGVYAQALNNLNKYDPAVVVFDIIFQGDRDADGDAKFANALKETKKPNLSFLYLIEYDDNTDRYESRIESALPNEMFSSLKNVSLGTTNIFPDSDDVIRRYPISFSNQYSQNYKSLAVIAAELYGNVLQQDQIPSMKNQFLINYSSDLDIEKHREYNFVSFLDLYNDDFRIANPDILKDKIIIIGPHAKTFNDSSFTPLSSYRQMHNIEIHANAIQTILDQKFLRDETLFEKLLVLLLLCAVSTFVFMYTKIRWSVLYLVLVPAGYTLAAPVMFDNGVIVDVIHPYMVMPTAFISIYVYRYMTEFKDKMALKGAFSKYVSANVVDEISKDPSKLKLGGDKREVSILFTDIAHFTSISENLKPESLVALLNEYLGVMSDVIMKEGGTLDKFEGDAIMAFFGAPLTQEDHAVRACNTILKMRQEMVELNKKWASDAPLPGGEKKPQIDFRCGINTGEVIVGNLGSKDRFDYTVMGDAVNLASRLEGANKQYETHIMISEQTFDVVKDAFVARELDIIKVVGKDEPIKVYELLGKSEDLGDSGQTLLKLYSEGISLYHSRKFEDGLNKFDEILKQFPDDGPSKLYRQRCEVLRNFPPPDDWDGVFEMRSK